MQTTCINLHWEGWFLVLKSSSYENYDKILALGVPWPLFARPTALLASGPTAVLLHRPSCSDPNGLGRDSLLSGHTACTFPVCRAGLVRHSMLSGANSNPMLARPLMVERLEANTNQWGMVGAEAPSQCFLCSIFPLNFGLCFPFGCLFLIWILFFLWIVV